MATAAELDVILRLRDEMTAQLQRANAALGNTEKQVKATSSAFTSAAKTAAGFATGMLAFGGAGKVFDMVKGSVIGFNSQMEQATIGFTTMLGSGQKAQAFLGDLQKFAATTPFEFPELVTASQRLLAMGFSAEKVVPTLTAVGDAVAALGGSGALVGQVTTALGQMQAKGKVSAEEMLQLTEAGIPAWDLLAKKIGVSVPEAMKMAEKGAISSGVALDAITSGMEDRFGGLMAKQSKTFSGAMSTISDSLNMAIGSAFKPFFDLLSKGAVQLATFLSGERFQAFAASVAAGMQSAIAGVTGFIQTLVGLFTDTQGTLLNFHQWLANAIGDGAATMITSAVGLIIATLQALAAFLTGDFAGGLATIHQAIAAAFGQDVADQAKAVFDTVVTVVQTAITTIVSVFGTIVGFIQAHWDEVQAVTAAFWDGYVTFVQAEWQLVLAVFTGLADWVQGEWAKLEPIARDAFEGVRAAVEEGLAGAQERIEGIVATIRENWPQIRETASEVWTGVQRVIGDALDGAAALIGSVAEAVRDHWGDIREAASAIWNTVKASVSDVISFIVAEVSRVTEGVRDNWPQIREAAENVFTAVKVVVAVAVAAIIVLWRTFGDDLLNVVRNTWELVKGTIDAAITVIGGVLKILISLLTGDWKGAWDGAKQVMQGFVDFGLTVATFLKNTLGVAIQVVADLLNGVFRGAVAAAGAALDAAKGAAQGLLDILRGIASALAAPFRLNISFPDPPGWLNNLIPHSPPPLAQGIEMINSKARELHDTFGSLWEVVGDGEAPVSGIFTTLEEATAAAQAMGLTTYQIMNGLSAEGIPNFVLAWENAAGTVEDATGTMEQGVLDLAHTIAGGAGFDQMRQWSADVKNLNVEIARLKQQIADAKAIGAWTGALEDQLKFLEGWKNQVQTNITTAKEYQAALDALKGAADGFGTTLSKTLSIIDLAGDFGEQGAAVIQSLTTAISENTPAAGAALAKTVDTLVKAMKAAQLPEWQATGVELREALMTALTTQDPADIQRVLDMIQGVNTQMVAAATLSGDTFTAAFNRSITEGLDKDVFGAQGVALMAAFTDAVEKGGAAAIAKLSKAAYDLIHTAETTLPPELGNLGAELMAALTTAVDDHSEEAVQAVYRATANINTALSVIPKNFAELAPVAQQAILALVTAVQDGSLTLQQAITESAAIVKILPTTFEDMVPQVQAHLVALQQAIGDGLNPSDAVTRAQAIIKLYPEGFADLPASVQHYIDQTAEAVESGSVRIGKAAKDVSDILKVVPRDLDALVPMARNALDQILGAVEGGTVSVRDGVNRFNAVMKLIPRNLEEMVPAVQAQIGMIVQAVVNGELSAADALLRLNAVLDQANKEAKARAEEAKRIVDEIEAYRRSAGMATPGPSTTQQYQGSGQGGISVTTQQNYAGVAGLLMSLVQDAYGQNFALSVPDWVINQYGSLEAFYRDLERRGVRARASGGPASGWTWVGERGPELVNLPGGSYVHSNADSMAMTSAGGSEAALERAFSRALARSPISRPVTVIPTPPLGLDIDRTQRRQAASARVQQGRRRG